MSTALRETMGLLFGLLSLYWYMSFRDKKNRWFAFLTGLAMSLVFFVRFHWGVMVITGIGIDLLISFGRRELRLADIKKFG